MDFSPNDHSATEDFSGIGHVFGCGPTWRSEDSPSSSIQPMYRTLLNSVMDEDAKTQRTSRVASADLRDVDATSGTDPSLALESPAPSFRQDGLRPALDNIEERIRTGKKTPPTQSEENGHKQLPPTEPGLRRSQSSSRIKRSHEAPDRLTRSILAGPHRSRSKKSVSFDDQNKVYLDPPEIYRSPSTRILDDLAYFARRFAGSSSLDSNRASLDTSNTEERNAELESLDVNPTAAASQHAPQVTVTGVSRTTPVDQNSGLERNASGVPWGAWERSSLARESHEYQGSSRESAAQQSSQAWRTERESEMPETPAPATPGNNIQSSSLINQFPVITLAADFSPPEHREIVQLASSTDLSPEEETETAPRNNTGMANIWAKFKYLWNVMWRNILDTLCYTPAENNPHDIDYHRFD
jgi:hypothetical protein